MLRQLSLPLIQPTCFFCQSHINPSPRDPRNFKCPHCQCWNRYDTRGEIISDEPAMHEPGMNTKSFARRGKLWPCLAVECSRTLLAQRHPGKTDFYKAMARLCSATLAKRIKYVPSSSKPVQDFALTRPPPDVADEPSCQLPPIPRGSFSLSYVHFIINIHL